MDFLAIRADVTPFVYVKHCASTVEFTRLGSHLLAARMGLQIVGIPSFVPLATQQLWSRLRSPDTDNLRLGDAARRVEAVARVRGVLSDHSRAAHEVVMG